VKFFLDTVMDGFETASAESLKARFGLTSYTQIECLYVYITTQGEISRSHQAVGSSIARAITVSTPILQEHTAFELASRTMAADDYKNERTCTSYFALVANDTTTAEICSKYDFSDLYML